MGSRIRDIDDRFAGQDLLHGVLEDFPLVGAVEIVAHEKAAALQVFAETFDLVIGQFPVADFDGVEPGIVEDVVGLVVEIHRLLHAARVDARQAADGGGEMAVGAGIVDGPVGVTLAPVVPSPVFALPVQPDAGSGVHQAGEDPLGALVPVGGKRKIVVFPGGILAEGTLGIERAHYHAAPMAGARIRPTLIFFQYRGRADGRRLNWFRAGKRRRRRNKRPARARVRRSRRVRGSPGNRG